MSPTMWNAKVVRKNEAAFKIFLTARGAEVLLTTNEWELIRFQSGNITSVIYTKKNGSITFYGDAQQAWTAFKNNSSWRAVPPTKRVSTGGRSIATLRARDGNNCFFCLAHVSINDESEEHLVSLTFGGPDHISNKVLAHRDCNTLAGHLSLAEKIRIHVASHLKKAKLNERPSRTYVTTSTIIAKDVFPFISTNQGNNPP